MQTRPRAPERSPREARAPRSFAVAARPEPHAGHDPHRGHQTGRVVVVKRGPHPGQGVPGIHGGRKDLGQQRVDRDHERVERDGAEDRAPAPRGQPRERHGSGEGGQIGQRPVGFQPRARGLHRPGERREGQRRQRREQRQHQRARGPAPRAREQQRDAEAGRKHGQQDLRPRIGAQGDATGGGEGEEGQRGGDGQPEQHIAHASQGAPRAGAVGPASRPPQAPERGTTRRQTSNGAAGRRGARTAQGFRAISIRVWPKTSRARARSAGVQAAQPALQAGGSRRQVKVTACSSGVRPAARASAIERPRGERNVVGGAVNGAWPVSCGWPVQARARPGCQSPGSIATSAPPGRQQPRRLGEARARAAPGRRCGAGRGGRARRRNAPGAKSSWPARPTCASSARSLCSEAGDLGAVGVDGHEPEGRGGKEVAPGMPSGADGEHGAAAPAQAPGRAGRPRGAPCAGSGPRAWPGGSRGPGGCGRVGLGAQVRGVSGGQGCESREPSRPHPASTVAVGPHRLHAAALPREARARPSRARSLRGPRVGAGRSTARRSAAPSAAGSPRRARARCPPPAAAISLGPSSPGAADRRNAAGHRLDVGDAERLVDARQHEQRGRPRAACGRAVGRQRAAKLDPLGDAERGGQGRRRSRSGPSPTIT